MRKNNTKKGSFIQFFNRINNRRRASRQANQKKIKKSKADENIKAQADKKERSLKFELGNCSKEKVRKNEKNRKTLKNQVMTLEDKIISEGRFHFPRAISIDSKAKKIIIQIFIKIS